MSSSLKIFHVLTLLAIVGCTPVATPVVKARGEGAPTLTCGSLAPTTDQDAIARVGALFSRPENATDLLRNLKLAYDTDLLHQPGFYASENLTRFFAGTAATWGERTTLSKDGAFRDIVITADDGVFPQITIQLRRSCSVEVRFEPPNRVRPDHLQEALLIHLLVGANTGFTLGAVRGVFGPASTQYVDNGADDQGPPAGEPRKKGVLIYKSQDGRAGAPTGSAGAEVTLNVRPDSEPAFDGHRPRQAVLNDSNDLGEIRFYEFWR
jgi:hypothetical protein